MSARFAIVDSLLYWPRELAIIIAEYSVPNQNERLSLLLPSSSGQKVIISDGRYGVLSVHWTDIIGHEQLFLRCSGIQSRELRMNDFVRMVCVTGFPQSWYDQVFYRRIHDFFVACHGGGTHSEIAMNEFITAFTRMFTEIV
jgi:hypothetical protein